MAEFEDIFETDSGPPLATSQWADPDYIANKYPYQPGCIWLGRHPHNYEQMIGYRTERHVFVCAETGGGKGRAFMVNNQVLWPGSLVTVGPKGDEATMAAVRRADGNDACVGMKQDVYVIDPMRMCKVPEKYRAFYDPLEGLRADTPKLVSRCRRIASAICKVSESGEGARWDKDARAWIARVIIHVVTTPRLPSDEERNLLTVRDFVTVGDVELANEIHKQRLKRAEQEAIEKGEAFDPDTVKKTDPYAILLWDMQRNPKAGRLIANAAAKLERIYRNAPKQFEGVVGSAGDLLDWMDDEDIERVLTRHEDGPQLSFKATDLKDKLISVFICLPESDYDFLDVWLRAMITSLCEGLTQNEGLGENKERVLFCIDEFANLGEMTEISSRLNSIRSAGVSLMIATQGIADLQRNYEKNWSRFPSAAGIEVYFQADEPEVGEYIEKKLGKKEIIKYPKTAGANKSRSVALAVSKAYSHTNSSQISHASGATTTLSEGESDSLGGGRSSGSSEGFGSNNGYSTAHGYGPGIFHIAHLTSTLQKGRSGGTSRNRSISQQRSENWNKTRNRQIALGTTNTETTNIGRSDTETSTFSQTETRQDGSSIQVTEQYHQIPLLSLSQARQELIAPEYEDHPAYPGMALVIADREPNPFFVRKCNYDQDPFFERKFLPNPSFKFLPLTQQPLFGWQITEDHFYRVKIPEVLRDYEMHVIPGDVDTGVYVPPGTLLFSVQGREEQTTRHSYKAPFRLKVIDQFNPNAAEEGEIMMLRADEVITPAHRLKLDRFFWEEWVKQHARRPALTVD